MSHYFEKTIVDAKDIYTDYLLNVFSPLVYYGLKSVYERAITEEKKYVEGAKLDPSIKNPGVIVLFQYFLRELETMNDEMIEQETGRFRDSSGCADVFDDLIKAVIKSHIIVLTFNASGKTCKVVKDKLHERVEPKSFVHKCYLECSRIFFDHPRLFFHEFPINERKDNERIIYQLVKVGIKNGIKRCLPMKAILEEYLKHDYIESTDDDPNAEYMKVKDLLKRDLEGPRDDGGMMKILDSSDASLNNDFGKLEQNVDDIETLIYGRHVDDHTFDMKNSSSEKKKLDTFFPVAQESLPTLVGKDKEPSVSANPIAQSGGNAIGGNAIDGSAKAELKQVSHNVPEPPYKDPFEILTKTKRNRMKDNVLEDAIMAVKNEPVVNKDDEISIMKSKVNRVSNADNFYDEAIKH
jgi:hypothetical protein